jgi:anti-sigma factor RsiW
MAREGQKRLSAYLDEDVHRRLKRAAFERETTMTEIVSQLVERFLDGDISLNDGEPPPNE